MTLGTQIVEELACRQLTGSFFDYAGYQRLKSISSPDELSQFLEAWHYQSPPQLDNASDTVDYLVAVDQSMAEVEQAWIWLAVLTGLIVPLSDLVFWIVALATWLGRMWRKRL